MTQEELKKTIPGEDKNVENKSTKKTSEVPEYVGPKFYGSEHPNTEVGDKHIQESLHDLVEKNIKWSQVIYNQNKKIKRRLTMMVIANYLRLFLLFAPILFGILYWPEISTKFTEYFGQYLGGNIQQMDISQLKNMLQSPK